MAQVAEQQWKEQQQHRKKRETHSTSVASKKSKRYVSGPCYATESCSLTGEDHKSAFSLPPGIHIPISPERESAIQLLISHIFSPVLSTCLTQSKTIACRSGLTKEARTRKAAFISRHWLKYGLPRKSFRYTGNFIDKCGFAGTHIISKWGAEWIRSDDTLDRLREGQYIELIETRAPKQRLFLMYEHLERAIELALPEEYCSFFVTLDPERCLCSAREWYEALEKAMYSK